MSTPRGLWDHQSNILPPGTLHHICPFQFAVFLIIWNYKFVHFYTVIVLSLISFLCSLCSRWFVSCWMKQHSVCSVVSDSATLWTAAHQASLSFTISQSLLKLMFIELVMPSNHLILCRPLPIPSKTQCLGLAMPHVPVTSQIWNNTYTKLLQFSSVQSLSCVWLWDPMDCSTPGFPVLHQLKLMSIESVMPSNHRILCYLA